MSSPEFRARRDALESDLDATLARYMDGDRLLNDERIGVMCDELRLILAAHLPPGEPFSLALTLGTEAGDGSLLITHDDTVWIPPEGA